MDIFDELVRLRRLGQKCALCTIVQVNGSIPSYEAAKMLVREDGSMTGTIGGGCVEAEVWTAAREVIESEKPRHLNFSLGQDASYDTGLICGGQLNVFIEPVIPQPHAFIFGAGHISKSLSKSPRSPVSPPPSWTTVKRSPTASASPKPTRSMPANTNKSSRN
jgi:xanthine dehydrogenase accessory factor